MKKKKNIHLLIVIAGIILFVFSVNKLQKSGKGYYDKSNEEKKIIDRKSTIHGIIIAIATIMIIVGGARTLSLSEQTGTIRVSNDVRSPDYRR